MPKKKMEPNPINKKNPSFEVKIDDGFRAFCAWIFCQLSIIILGIMLDQWKFAALVIVSLWALFFFALAFFPDR